MLAFAEGAPLGDLRLEFFTRAEKNVLADADLAAGPDQALPLVWILTQLPSQQNFDAPLEEIARRGVVGTDRLGLRATPPAVEPGGKYAGVVEHEKVVGPQKAGKVAEDEVLGSSGLPIQVEHPRSAAVGQSAPGRSAPQEGRSGSRIPAREARL